MSDLSTIVVEMINHLVGTQEGLQMSREINGEHVPAADTLGQMVIIESDHCS